MAWRSSKARGASDVMREQLRRLSWAIAGAGVLLIGIAMAVFPGPFAAATAAGAAVAVLNWFAIVFLVQRSLHAVTPWLLALMGLKMLALFAVCAGLVLRLGFDGPGLAFGLSALVVGLIVGGAFAIPATRSHPGESGESGEAPVADWQANASEAHRA